MIQAQGLYACYADKTVLHNLDLTVQRGEFSGVLGPNGSGKTTLIRLLSGALAPSAGTIRLAGQDIAPLSARARARLCATVAQNNAGLLRARVLSLALMGRYPHIALLGGYARADHDRARAALKEAQALHLETRQASTLSGGEMQRVIMAKALAQDADLLLLDEAASNLDVARTVDLYDLLLAKNQTGLTILTVAHDLNLAALYCRRLIFLKNGCIVADGPTKEIFSSQTLSEIYETPIVVAPHPVTGAPQAHLLPQSVLRPGLDNPGLV